MKLETKSIVALPILAMAGLMLWVWFTPSNGGEAWDRPEYFGASAAIAFVAGLLMIKPWWTGPALILIPLAESVWRFFTWRFGPFGFVEQICFVILAGFLSGVSAVGTLICSREWRAHIRKLLVLVWVAIAIPAYAQLDYLRQDFADAWVDSWHNPQNGDIAANLFRKSDGSWAAYMIIRPCNWWYGCRDQGYSGWRYEVQWYVFGIAESFDGFQDDDVPGLSLLSNAYGLYFLWHAALAAQDEIWFSPLAPNITINGCTKVPSLWWRAACDAHDVRYGTGGNRMSRLNADFYLLADLNRLGGPGKLYFIGVRSFGCHFFTYVFDCNHPYHECQFGYQEWGFPFCAMGHWPLPSSCAGCGGGLSP
jgi:hypothetical protein